jgi:18S rRNA (guanine1575-N7)-methyltransferase
MKENRKGWHIRTERPEEIHLEPNLYYTDEEIGAYASSGGMKRTQEKIAVRILELLDLSKAKILDLGCGVGYTTEIYQNAGYDVVGLDVLPKMLEHAKAKGLRTVQGDMRELPKLFEEGEFDAVVSASALQWLTAREDLKRAASAINHVLKSRGKIVIQFYPKSEEEMENTARIFKRQGFEGEIVIDNPDNPKKRTIYLVMRKAC